MGTPHGARAMSSSRDAILTAIRSAGVPAAPAAAPVVRPSHPDDVVRAFIAVLPSVGSEGVEQDATHPIDALTRAWFPPSGAPPLMLRARCGVAENGAVYLESNDVSERAAIVLAEHIVVLVSRQTIVPTMHEAVSQLHAGAGCSWFLSGPSKTADIEQSLVIGAQGSRTLRVIVTD